MSEIEKIPKWTIAMEATFIEIIKFKPNLWNIRHKLYTKNKLKIKTYQDIGRELLKIYPDCKELFGYDALLKKFNCLKTYYKREYRKMKFLPSSSDGCMVTSPWEHFNRMSFLNSIMEPPASSMKSSDTDPQMDESGSVMEESLDKDSDRVTVTTQPLVAACSSTYNSNSPISENKRKNIVEQTMECIEKISAINRQTEKQSFGNLVADLVYKIKDEGTKSALRLEIFKVIHEFTVNNL